MPTFSLFSVVCCLSSARQWFYSVCNTLNQNGTHTIIELYMNMYRRITHTFEEIHPYAPRYMLNGIFLDKREKEIRIDFLFLASLFFLPLAAKHNSLTATASAKKIVLDCRYKKCYRHINVVYMCVLLCAFNADLFNIIQFYLTYHYQNIRQFMYRVS